MDTSKPILGHLAAPPRPRDMVIFALLVAICLLITRLAAFGLLGIRPDPVHLHEAYQHLAIRDLYNDLFWSLIRLHSQPPLWNLMLGLAAKTCEAQTACMVKLILVSHVCLTALAGTAIYVCTAMISGRNRLSMIVAITYLLTPAVFYYENFLLYAHFTSAVFALSCLCLSMLLYSGRTLWFALFALSLVILSLTWALFHPIYLFLVLGFTMLKTGNHGMLRAAMFAGALGLSLLPSVKNQSFFGFFGAGSWLGLNASQVAPDTIDGCSFKSFAEANDLVGVHVGTALNDPRIIARADDCLERTLVSIKAQPHIYVADAVQRTLLSLSLWPNEYLFPPPNWDHFPRLPDTPRQLTADNQIIIDASISRFVTLMLNLCACAALIQLATTRSRGTTRAFFQIMLLSAILFLGVAHAVNGPEQERMRYTIHPLFWGLYCAIGFEIAARLRQRSTRVSA